MLKHETIINPAPAGRAVPSGTPVSALAVLERDLGIRVTVHDCRGLVPKARRNPLLRGYHLHRHPFCAHGRDRNGGGWGGRCYRDCCLNSDAGAAERLSPFLKTCWKGASELVVPIARDNMLALTLYVGVFREPGSRPPAECGRTAAALHSKLPPLNMARITELEAVARLAGQGLLDDLARFDSPVSSPELSRRRRIADFIARNYRGRIGLGDLARHLHLSPSRASHCVRSCFGKPFQELLIQERMERARLMLLAGDFTLDETAAACGVEDTHYFNRLFRRTFGTPPGKFRDKFAEKIEI